MKTEVNVPLLRKVVEWAEAEAARPLEVREWEQGAWMLKPDQFDALMFDPATRIEFMKSTECGTCYCIAGKVAVETLEAGEYMSGNYIFNGHGDLVCSIGERAGDELGIPRDNQFITYNSLFASDNTIDDVRRIAEDLAGEPL